MNAKILFTCADGQERSVEVPSGTLLTEAAARAGLEISQPCGGQGRCGRCAVQVTAGNVHRRSTMNLTREDVANGYALACQATVTEDGAIYVPVQEKIERRLTSNRYAEISRPSDYDFQSSQNIRRLNVTMTPPSLDDQTDDFTRLQTAIRVQYGYEVITTSLSVLRRLGQILRIGDWQVTAYLEEVDSAKARLITINPGLSQPEDPVWACAIDIGTTTVSLWLVDLVSGEVKTQVADYNAQISRGEDVISRILFSTRKDGEAEMQKLVIDTINRLTLMACQNVGAQPTEIVKAIVAGNTTMIHLFLGIPAESIRLTPFVPAINNTPVTPARELGLNFCPDALVDCLPGVASYVGADITAGVLSGGIADSECVSLFIDIGTNGEIVLGNSSWLMTCACSAGPAFEGAGVKHGMRATFGAIEDVWVNREDYEPNIQVIGKGKPVGICGSGLIALMAELFLVGVLDKAGNFNLHLNTPRVRPTESGGEYVVVWADQTENGEDIVLTHVDVDNLMRAKAAIYAGFTGLAEKVGLTLNDVDQMLIAGSFGKYINIEKAIQIGLLPDLPQEKFKFLGNTAVKGAYFALLNENKRLLIDELASRMTYIELSVDNTFYEEFTLAMFLPHTNTSLFPTVEKAILNPTS